MTCDFQQCAILTSVYSDEPVQPPKYLEKLIKFDQSLNTHIIIKRQAKALISLRVCAGWSEPLQVAHTTLLVISCHRSFVPAANFVPAEILVLAANFVLAGIFMPAAKFVLAANFVLADIFVPAANFVLAAIFFC